MEYLHVLSRPKVIDQEHDVVWTEAYIDSTVSPQGPRGEPEGSSYHGRVSLGLFQKMVVVAFLLSNGVHWRLPYLYGLRWSLSKQGWWQLLISENVAGSSGRCLVSTENSLLVSVFSTFFSFSQVYKFCHCGNDDRCVRFGPCHHQRGPVLGMNLGSQLGKVGPPSVLTVNWSHRRGHSCLFFPWTSEKMLQWWLYRHWLLLQLWPWAHSKAKFQGKKILVPNYLKRRSVANRQIMAQWPGFLCNCWVIFHSHNESDGSGSFRLLIVNVLRGPPPIICVGINITLIAVTQTSRPPEWSQWLPWASFSLHELAHSCCSSGSCRQIQGRSSMWEPILGDSKAACTPAHTALKYTVGPWKYKLVRKG